MLIVPKVILARYRSKRSIRGRLPERLLPQTQRIASSTPEGFQHPSSRANPCTKGTDPICRLPSATFNHWPEASRLGDRMRLSVRACVKERKNSLAFEARYSLWTPRAKDSAGLFATQLCLRPTQIQQPNDGSQLERKDDSPARRASRGQEFQLCHRSGSPRHGTGLLAQFPFHGSRYVPCARPDEPNTHTASQHDKSRLTAV